MIYHHPSFLLDETMLLTRPIQKAELGPHANERRMPQALFKQLQDEAKITRVNTIRPDGTIVAVEKIPNQTAGLIPVLAQLSGSDPAVHTTYLCNPRVRHVFKMRNEGGFCGYRNIQSLITYIRDARASGHEHFPNRVPTIPELQDMIERAWDMGFNADSRDDIGSIKGTRKYIGTSEVSFLFPDSTVLRRTSLNTDSQAQALLQSLKIE